MWRISVFRQPIRLLVTAILAVSTVCTISKTLRSGSTHTAQQRDVELMRPPTSTDEVEVELITLRPYGFEPAEITRFKGSFVLFVDDRSGQEHSSLVLQRDKGDRLRAVNLNRKKSEWQGLLELPPGDYVLQDTDNADLRCRLTILP
jgi:hypothetical protein